ncbi:LuxR C-terminal-related transcriptional regulator [Kitasatospora sp. NPDC096147]|uniref:LuxR C-terminal-related transcriptional regulator n=1 Tax=Kitasatospora sp. NPDC096147 TaxID=3364093 RepID=UPI0037F5B1A5
MPELPDTEGESEEVALPDEAERALYLEVLASGGRVPRGTFGAADQAAVARLVAGGLLAGSPDGLSWLAVDPRSVSARISAGLRSAGTRKLLEAEQLGEQLADFTAAFDAAPRRSVRSGVVRHVHDARQVVDQARELEAAAREILTAQSGAPLAPEQLADSTARARAFVARGGTARVLYEPAARTDPATVAYARSLTELGIAVRVLGEPFKRITVFDRTVAVVPAAADQSSAAFVEDPAVVAFLVGGFERDWQRAEQVAWAGDPAAEPERPVEEQIGRLLAAGLTQRTIALRLGLSERTVAGHLSRLRELHGAETLFQLGWRMREGDGSQ